MDSVEMKLVHHKTLGALATESQADEGEVGASTLGNGGGSDGVVDHQVLTVTLDLSV